MFHHRFRPARLAVPIVLAAALVAAACSSDDSSSDSSGGDGTTTAPADSTTSTTTDGDAIPVVFNGQGNDLLAYASEPPFDSQKVITNAGDDPENGLDINAQICFWDQDGETWFIAGEDTGQPDPPAGWGIFRLDGSRVGDFEATQIGKLTPTYQEGADPENYGCGLLSDGRMVTTDVGTQQLGAGTGQLIIWFPPFDSNEVAYCKIDTGIPTAQQVAIGDDDSIYVSSARPGVDEDRTPGVWKYSGPFPTGPDAEGGCGSTDATGAPVADSVDRSLFIQVGDGLAAPTGLTRTHDDGFYVASVITGVINEYDSAGAYLRTVLQPPDGEELGEQPFSTGTPLGIGVGPDGTLYYADIGIVVTPERIGPGDHTGAVRRILFDDSGDPMAPETMADGLAFPDGIGVFVP